MKLFFYFFSWSLLLTSCADSTPEKNELPSKPKIEQVSDCEYKIKKSGVMLRWVAFKTTKRIGVSGTFNEIKIDVDENASSLLELLASTSFEIDSKTVNSNMEVRDKKIVNFFFGRLAGDFKIYGKVKSVNITTKKGVFLVNMNGISKNVPFVYSLEGKQIIITAGLNTNNWSAQTAIESINQACEEKHKGDDGVSKTWPEVDIDIRIPMIIICK